MPEVLRISMNSALYKGERDLRNRELLRPIGVPDFGWEMYDVSSFHFVAVDGEEVVGCALLYPVPLMPGEAQLMQMAVSSSSRGTGLGRQLMEHVTGFALESGFASIVCHARDSAVGFYRRHGFRVYGEPFEEVGVTHSYMRLILK